MTRARVAILCAAALAVFAASFALWGHGETFVSPDENANFFFSRTYAETGRLFVVEPLNVRIGDVLAPRSILALGGRLVPGGFAGLPFLYGGFARAFGMWVLPLLTPLLAAASVIAWAAVCRKLFGGRVGWWSGILLAFHPAWWLYATRGFMPNVPFTALLIAAAFFLLIRPVAWLQHRHQKRVVAWMDPALAGLALGAALLIRTVEAPWVLLGLAGVAVWQRRAVTRALAVPFLCGLLLVLAPLPFLNRELYGAWYATGYTAGSAQSLPGEWAGLEAERAETQSLAPWRAALNAAAAPLFPFGIHPRRILVEVKEYGVAMFWWMSVLSAAGLWFVWARRKDSTVHGYFVLAAFVTLWLATLYGSWSFADNPDPTKITIGNSHVRYWLPAFVLLTPFAAMTLDALVSRVRSARGQVALTAVLTAALLGLDVRAAYLPPSDGIHDNQGALARFAAARAFVLERTEPDAVLIADRADKFLFPARPVRYPLRDDRTYALLPRLLSEAPVYYFGLTLPEKDLRFLNETKLPTFGARVDPVESIGDETLYRFSIR